MPGFPSGIVAMRRQRDRRKEVLHAQRIKNIRAQVNNRQPSSDQSYTPPSCDIDVDSSRSLDVAVGSRMNPNEDDEEEQLNRPRLSEARKTQKVVNGIGIFVLTSCLIFLVSGLSFTGYDEDRSQDAADSRRFQSILFLCLALITFLLASGLLIQSRRLSSKIQREEVLSRHFNRNFFGGSSAVSRSTEIKTVTHGDIHMKLDNGTNHTTDSETLKEECQVEMLRLDPILEISEEGSDSYAQMAPPSSSGENSASVPVNCYSHRT